MFASTLWPPLAPLLLAALAALAAGCGGSSSDPHPTAARFLVRSESGEGGAKRQDRIVVEISNPESLAAARAALRGGITVSWVGGKVADGDGGYNADPVAKKTWAWHFEDVRLAEVTAEAYQTWPNDVEEQLAYWRDNLGSAYVPGTEIEAEITAPE